MHWEEEVIGPVIFGNNYDPLQEVIINGEGKGRTGKEGTTVDSNCVCKEVAWKCAYPLLLHTHSVRANVLGPAWHSGLKNTALQASIWTQRASCACRKLMGFPTGNKRFRVFFSFWLRTHGFHPLLSKLSGIDSVTGQEQVYLVKTFPGLKT